MRAPPLRRVRPKAGRGLARLPQRPVLKSMTAEIPTEDFAQRQRAASTERELGTGVKSAMYDCVVVVLMSSEYAFLWSGSSSVFNRHRLMPVNVISVLLTLSSYLVQLTQPHSVT